MIGRDLSAGIRRARAAAFDLRPPRATDTRHQSAECLSAGALYGAACKLFRERLAIRVKRCRPTHTEFAAGRGQLEGCTLNSHAPAARLTAQGGVRAVRHGYGAARSHGPVVDLDRRECGPLPRSEAEFRQRAPRCRRIAGWRFDSPTRCWLGPFTPQAVDAPGRVGPRFTPRKRRSTTPSMIPMSATLNTPVRNWPMPMFRKSKTRPS